MFSSMLTSEPDNGGTSTIRLSVERFEVSPGFKVKIHFKTFARLTRFLSGVLLMLFAANLMAAPQIFQSAETQTHLIELYTSEGCSSCPPAEAWLNSLKKEPGLWKDFVPVALHVDYWDNLGWPDKFASKAYTERQRSYAAVWKSDTIYTPEYVLNGQEWRGLFSSRKIPARSSTTVGILKASANADGSWTIDFTPADKQQKSWEITVAVLGNDYQVEVKRGENEGRNLAHDFVVLSLEKHAMRPAAEGFSAAVKDLKIKPKTALAVWVTKAGSLTPIQATGGWLTPSQP